MREYEIIRSARRTLTIEVTRDARVIVRAPAKMPVREIRECVLSHEDWISRHVAKQLRNPPEPEPTEAERAGYITSAKSAIPPLVAKWEAKMGVLCAGITITSAKTRFGSCSPRNRLSFSWRLMQYPDEAVEYVVVHELAHILHKDHSPAFYATVARFLPDWKARRDLLRGSITR